MPSILVVEPELDAAHRIRDLLIPLGMQVRIASEPGQAFEASAAEAPDLVLVSSEVAGAGSIANSFSRRSGGPGVIAVLAATPLARFFAAEGDDQITKPFSDQDLLQAVERALAANPVAPVAPATPKKMVLSPDMKLTSQDIFGDVLAEVESAIPTLPAPPRSQPPRPPVTARTGPVQPADDEMKRKLEKTLSGVLGPEFLSRPAPTPRKPELPPDDVDALISKTLSNLDMGARSRPASPPAPASPQPPSPPAATSQAPAPRPQTKTDLDFAEIADLARTGRRSEPAPAVPPAEAAERSRPAFQPPAAPPSPPVSPSPPPPRVEPPPAAPMATQRIEMSGLLFEDDGEGGEQFGQYRLLEKIAVGGMAELWKARMRGVQGFQKTVAIKKILPHMTDNSDFVEMFIDEAKLAAQLNHPNIVHIYDLGKIGRDYYIAMEFVEGKDLRSLLNRAAKNGQSVPVPLALLIAARLASALHYAHRKRDFEGREMGLVHRDVSPQNVLLTLDGDVKLCDFGIAKAVSKVSQTQVGALKGKLQYMSPEQAWGKAVDFRSDIFSLGAILFELLTGERLFPGDSEMSILEAVRQNRIRSPRDVVPSILPEVDEIVGKALATQPEDRYASAGEMEHRIEALLHELRLTPGSADLANFIQDVITSQPRDDRFRRPATPATPATPAAPPPAVAPPSLPEPEPTPEPVSFVEPPLVETAPAAVAAPPPTRETTVVPIAPLGELPPPEKRGKGWIVIVLLVLAVALAAVYFLFVKPRTATAPAVPPASAPAGNAGKAAAPSPATADTPPAPQAAVPEAMIQGQVEEALAKQQQELQREFEEKKRQLEREIARNKAAAKAKPPSPSDPPSPPSR